MSLNSFALPVGRHVIESAFEIVGSPLGNMSWSVNVARVHPGKGVERAGRCRAGYVSLRGPGRLRDVRFPVGALTQGLRVCTE